MTLADIRRTSALVEIKSFTGRMSQVRFAASLLDRVLNLRPWLALVDLLSPVHDAAYSRAGRIARCHPGTREEVLKQILRRLNKSSGRPICWLSGSAGSGKSALSQTIAELLATSERLAASFFFFRGAGERSKIAHFIPTLVYQLSLSVPSTKPLIFRIILDEPRILERSFKYQIEKLLIGPMQKARNPILLGLRKPMVIVLDGLDECDDREPMAEFIEAIIGLCQTRRCPFRFLCTSRVEEHIRKPLDDSAGRAVTYLMSLQDFDAHIDISKFLRSQFTMIYERNRPVMRHLPQPWPSDFELAMLVEKASGSFIFALTLVNYVSDGSDFPHRKLPTALQVDSGLDPLYTQVLSAASRDTNFDQVMSAVVLLSKSFSTSDLGGLLGLETADVVHALIGVQSILMIPEDDTHHVQFFHTSLRDFLTTPARSRNFFISAKKHMLLAIGCLQVLQNHSTDSIFFESEAQLYSSYNWDQHFLQALVEGHTIDPNEPNTVSLMSYLNHLLSHTLNLWINTLLLEYHQKKAEILEQIVNKLKVSLVAQMPFNEIQISNDYLS